MAATLKPSTSRLYGALLPGAIIFLGILLTLWIQTFTRDGVVFSGDGGLKALLAQQLSRQLAAGDLTLDMALQLPAADWVEAVWQQGLYPFTPPFVYEVGAKHFITFPFTFPLVSAPFYALLGDRGLYVVPLVALWSIWLRFWQIGRRAGWSMVTLCLGLVSLVFASPLTLYGGMYWEHTLAVALAFWGVSILLFAKDGVLANGTTASLGFSHSRLLAGGVLVGLAVWFRPEFLCLVAAIALLSIVGWLIPRWQLSPSLSFTQVLILIGSMVGSVGLFFVLNTSIYGHPLGIHAIQIVEESSLSTQIAQAKDGYQQMFGTLWRYFPVVIVVALAACLSPEFKKKSGQRDPVPARFALALSILFALSVPLIVPPGAGGKQWGPRFYLILVPLLSFVLAEQLRSSFFPYLGASGGVGWSSDRAGTRHSSQYLQRCV